MKVTTVGDGSLLSSDEKLMAGLDLRRPWRYVVEFSHEDFAGAVVEDSDGAAVVWNDLVVNSWCELFSSTGVALMRLATLMYATEDEQSLGYVNDAAGFTKAAYTFLMEQAR